MTPSGPGQPPYPTFRRLWLASTVDWMPKTGVGWLMRLYLYRK